MASVLLVMSLVQLEQLSRNATVKKYALLRVFSQPIILSIWTNSPNVHGVLVRIICP